MNTKNPDTGRFAEGLRNLMDREKITSSMLSEWSGLSRGAIASWRVGRAYPQPEKLAMLEKTLRMTAAEIAEVKPAPKPKKLEPVYRCPETDAQYSRWFSTGMKILMHRHEMKAVELARLCGVTASTVMSWLREERSPKLTSGLQVAAVFRTTVEDIVMIGQEAEEKCR